MAEDEHPVLFRRAGRTLHRDVIRGFAVTLRDTVARGVPFSCLITDDLELQRLNRQFLGNDYPADVLSFPSGSDTELGDIAISVNRAAEQAARLGHTPDEEVGILMLHGVLHLLGMDHEKDKGAMARAEKRWRSQLGLPVGLLERSRK
jgi:probable rRNA maturation factor